MIINQTLTNGQNDNASDLEDDFLSFHPSSFKFEKYILHI